MSSEDKADSGLAAEKAVLPRKSDGGGSIDLEATQKHIPYPKSVIFIVVCEFCERFNYYGMRAILTLYFKNILGWDEDFATVIYHLFTMFCYFTPLLGAMLADSLLGKFRTIFYLAVVYACGSVVITLAATPPISIPAVPFSMIGLGLIAIGTGGIKPCVAAFGGDQFTIPGQESQLASYFAVFYFAINSGSLISTTVTPIFREDVSCFGDDTCYPLAFSVPAALMIVALVIFLIGRPFYTIHKPEGNVVLQVLSAIKHALQRKGPERKAGREREHWMDYADDKFDKKFLEDTKSVLKVLFLYLPLPIFWALFDQQGSRWTFQATRMDGNTFGYLIKPDQMQVINPLLVLAFIPLFDRVFYPLLAKCGILKKPLQRLAIGGVFAGIAFAVSGIVELQLEKTYALELKGSESSVHFVNTFSCPVGITLQGASTNTKPYQLEKLEYGQMHLFEAIQADSYTATFEFTPGTEQDQTTCPDLMDPITIVAEKETATTFVLYMDYSGSGQLYASKYKDELEKSEEGDPLVRFIYIDPEKHPIDVSDEYNVTVLLGGNELHGNFLFPECEHEEVGPNDYEVNLGVAENSDEIWANFNGTSYDLKLGGNYIFTIVKKSADPIAPENFHVHLNTVTEPNSVHMAWLLPQYVIMTMGEIMFSITIMDFSYAEAPATMKSVMQSAWLMTVAFGNLVVVIIAELKIFDKQWKEFFLFAGLMFIDMIIFAYMAYQYVPNKKPDHAALEHNEDSKEKEPSDKKDEGNDNEAYED